MNLGLGLFDYFDNADSTYSFDRIWQDSKTQPSVPIFNQNSHKTKSPRMRARTLDRKM